jgi:excisionase family DNA binding protein
MSSAGRNVDEGENLGAVTIASFRQRFGLGNTKVYEEIKAGRLRAVKVGNRTLILFADAKAWAHALPESR